MEKICMICMIKKILLLIPIMRIKHILIHHVLFSILFHYSLSRACARASLPQR